MTKAKLWGIENAKPGDSFWIEAKTFAEKMKVRGYVSNYLRYRGMKPKSKAEGDGLKFTVSAL